MKKPARGGLGCLMAGASDAGSAGDGCATDCLDRLNALVVKGWELIEHCLAGCQQVRGCGDERGVWQSNGFKRGAGYAIVGGVANNRAVCAAHFSAADDAPRSGCVCGLHRLLSLMAG